MKKLICILATAALFGACEKRTDLAAPTASPAPGTNTAADPNTLPRSKKPTLTSQSADKTEAAIEPTTAASPTP